MQLFYTVRPGDTLYQIASRWKLPVDSLIAANNIREPYTIYIGQQLSVPPGVDMVRVQPGDTVYKLSRKFGVPESFIIEANQLRPPYLLQVGQLLHVPPGVPYYVVQPGDTLFEIARRFHVTTEGRSNPALIRTVNRLPSDLIFPGMRLTIPYAPPGGSGLIAYVSNHSGEEDIWLYNPGNGTSRRLTNGTGAVFSKPFWSPDSSRIAFAGRNNILYVVRIADGAIARIDQFSDAAGVYLDWSPNSQRIAYSRQDAIILYHISTHQAERIKEPGATDVQWFPGGMELLFQAPDTSGVSQLFQIRTDGSGKRQLTRNTGGRYNNVRLSPDGTAVLYTSPGASISIIYVLELSTGNVTEVEGGPLAKNYNPVWSPNAERIAYSATAFENAGYFSLIRTTGRQGLDDRTWALSDCFATPVTWSPDSGKIAYLSGCNDTGAASEMWVIDVRHPVPVRLLKGGAIMALQWSPTSLSAERSIYTNRAYNVRFDYPGHWQRVDELKYEGPDGFFQISAIATEETLNQVCHNEAYQQLLPYGSRPRILPTSVQNQQACFIFPSDDQPAEMRGQAALIVRYPTPVVIGETAYQYFILWADQNHIEELSMTLVFLSR